MPLSDLWQPYAAASSDGENPSDSDSDRDKVLAQECIQKLKRQQQTSRARAASLLSRQKKKLDAENQISLEAAGVASVDDVTAFQHTYFADKKTHYLDQQLADERVHSKQRAVWLYFRKFADAVKAFFRGEESSEGNSQPPQFAHVISVNICDDTDIKLGSGSRGSSEVRSVMNNIQHQIVAHDGPADQRKISWFTVHQPLVALSQASSHQVLKEFLAWMMSFSGVIGWRLRSFNVPANLLANTRYHCVVFVGDANKINDALLRELSKHVHYKSLQVNDRMATAAVPESVSESAAASVPVPSFSPVLQVKCLIHQVCLTRKTLALGFGGYWSTLVRLGHLFESHSFRRKFYLGIAKLITDNFEYILLQELPPSITAWKMTKINELRMFSDSGSSANSRSVSRRLRILHQLLLKDNGDPSSKCFVHWCVGKTCCPNGPGEALGTLISSYSALFAVMPVPLLYRWKHAPAANDFVRDGFFLHSFLPRVLALLPTVKCDLGWKSV